MITILIADDHPMVREGLAAMLASERDFEVTAMAEDGFLAMACLRAERPDIILSDVRMPGMGGFELLAKAREEFPGARVLLLAGMPLKSEEDRARQGGACGYLPKNVDQDRLMAAIRGIVAGTVAFACEEFQSAPNPLSAREMDVLKLVAKGLQREQIAAELGIGSESVKTHLKGMMAKLGCSNSVSAVGKAYELGILRA